MTVKMLTPDVGQFDPTPSINLWNQRGPRARRPFYKSTKQGLLASALAGEQGTSENLPDDEEDDVLESEGATWGDSGSDGDTDFEFGCDLDSDPEANDSDTIPDIDDGDDGM